jgi:hypothetical protein
MGIGSHQSARAVSTTWLTPQPIIDALGGWQRLPRPSIEKVLLATAPIMGLVMLFRGGVPQRNRHGNARQHGATGHPWACLMGSK